MKRISATDQEIIDECIDRNFFEEEENKNA